MCSRALSNAFATTCCSMVHTMFAGTYITTFFIMPPNVDVNVGKWPLMAPKWPLTFFIMAPNVDGNVGKNGG